MAKSTFGNTWWGKSWLNALDKIDYDNRLPRGRRYANNGSVKAIEIKKNVISAKVQGSAASPYRVKVAVPTLSELQKTALKDQIQLHPQVYAAILNQELSPDIEGIAASKGIALFPSKWHDLDMSCSCPDWAVPCKHIAAVIYLVTDAIDRDPWLIFQMKGLDLRKELAELKGDAAGMAFHQPEDFFYSDFPKSYADTAPPASLREVDFSKIPYLREPIYKLLAPKPLFWKEDFREEWDDRIGTTSKNFKRWEFLLDDSQPLPIATLRKGHQVQLFLNEEFKTTVVGVLSPHSDEPEGHTLGDLITSLAMLGPDDLHDLDASTEALWHLYAFCRVLIAKGAVRPMLLQSGSNGYAVAWLPAATAQEVAQLLTLVNAAIPPDLVFTLDTRSKDESWLPAKPAYLATVICSQLLGMLIAEFGIDTPTYFRSRRELFDEPAPTRDPVLDLFFGGMTVAFSGFGSASIPVAIQKWLDIFELGQRHDRPILVVEAVNEGDFSLQLQLEDLSQPLLPPITLAELLHSPAHARDRATRLKAIHLLASLVRPIHDLLTSSGKAPIIIKPEDLLEILLDKLPLVELLGVQVMLPNILKSLVRPKASVSIDTQDRDQDGMFKLDDLLSFDWQVSVGADVLSPEEFFALLKTTHGLVKMRSQYVLIQPDELEKLRKRFERGAKPSPQKLFHAALSGEFEGSPALLSPAVKKLIRELTEIKEMPIPEGIHAELRPYQKRGFAWMYKNARIGLGSVIADDMGLGKTLQVLTLIEQLRAEGKLQSTPALAVVPTSLLANWKKEAERFAPNLQVEVFHGSDRKLPREPFDLLVTTYGTMRSDLAAIKKMKWGLLVIDEAQNIKNADTAQSKALRSIPAAVHIAMSGTPVENRLTDYWSIFDFAQPGYLGTMREFKEDYATPITRYRDPDALRVFHSITAPFIMRRLKTDPKVISDLPDKIVHNQWAPLEQKQASVYENVVNVCLREINGAKDDISRRGLVLKMLTALKQVCNHPVQYLKKGSATTETSGKAAALVPILEGIASQHEKCLIFTQYTEMGKLLQQMLQAEMGIEASFLHGGLNPKQREELVTEFQTDPHRKVFILSLKAGGTGLNLTAANHVIHYDLWWNPAVENQATDRAFRIGQRKNVMVHRLICKGTLEERIDEMLNTKRALAELTVAQGENWIGDLSNADLRALVRLGG
jgi:uncharacterized Zn finger protein/superfamily II DNA or RNA helicase